MVDRLLQDARVDPILSACMNGHLYVVERLIQDSRVDPSASNNSAIQCAYRCSHPTIVVRLLQDERVATTLSKNRWTKYSEILHRDDDD